VDNDGGLDILEGAKPWAPPACFRSLFVSYSAFDGPIRNQMAAQSLLCSICRPLDDEIGSFVAGKLAAKLGAKHINNEDMGMSKMRCRRHRIFILKRYSGSQIWE